MLDSIRYLLAWLMIVFVPPALAYWLVLHPFAPFWRRHPSPWAFGAATLAMVAVALPLAFWAPALLEWDLGGQPVLWIAALPLLGVSIWLEILCRRHLRLAILAGLPEVRRNEPQKLLREGVSGHLRHPRYAGALLGLTATALVANHLASWILWALTWPGLWLIIVLEERELADRLGQAYEEYRRDVPALVPRR